MSAAINQFGLHTIEYSIRKKQLEDPFYIAAHPELLPEPVPQYYAHDASDGNYTRSSPLTTNSIDQFYSDQLSKNIWAKPVEDSPSMYQPRPGELFDNPKLRHTLEVNSPYVPYGGYVHPKVQTRWEELPALPPEISKEKKREKFPIVLSSMTRYIEELCPGYK